MTLSVTNSALSAAIEIIVSVVAVVSVTRAPREE
jgi:hypothetical protein